MEPNQQSKKTQKTSGTLTEEDKDELLKDFCEREYEEVEDGFIDNRGFYTTPNGSFWDQEKEYFNHLGFDKHGGTYDDFGVYIPGPNYDEERGIYKDEEDLFISPDDKKLISGGVSTSVPVLKEQAENDKIIMKNVDDLQEKDEDSSLTFDNADIKEAIEDNFVLVKNEGENKDQNEENYKITEEINLNNTENEDDQSP